MRQYKFDLYSALGIDKNASQQEIKQAYLRLAKEFHPDLNKDLSPLEKEARENAMYGINEAYSILSDPKERIKYDIITESIRLASPSFYNLVRKVNGGAADGESDNPLEWRLEQLLSKSKDIIGNVKAHDEAKKVANEVSSALKISVNFLRTVYRLYEEERAYKGKSINRRA